MAITDHQSFRQPGDRDVGVWRYMSLTKFVWVIDLTNNFNYVMHKRKSFEHERELRAVIWTPAAKTEFDRVEDRGLIVPVPINDLIQRIYINPNADPILLEVVNGLKQTNKLDCEIVKSNVNDPPDY